MKQKVRKIAMTKVKEKRGKLEIKTSLLPKK